MEVCFNVYFENCYYLSTPTMQWQQFPTDSNSEWDFLASESQKKRRGIFWKLTFYRSAIFTQNDIDKRGSGKIFKLITKERNW